MVMGYEFGHVQYPFATGCLEPASHLEVQAGSLRTGELPVGNIPDQHVGERELVLSFHRGSTNRANQLPGDQRPHRRPDPLRVTGAQEGESAGPEHLADD